MTVTAETPIFRDSEADLRHRAGWWTRRALVYGALVLWTVVCLFPIFWTVTTSFKQAPDVMQGRLLPLGAPGEESWLLGSAEDPSPIGATSFGQASMQRVQLPQ